MNSGDQQPETEELSESLAQNDVAFVPPTKSASRWSVIGFVALLAFVGIFGFIRLHHGPKAATAAVQTAQADKTINQFLSGGTKNVQQMKALLHNTEKQVHIFEAYPSVKQVPLGNLKTNPFVYQSDSKSAAEAAAKRAEEEAAIQKAAQSLKLQTIMYSPTRGACMINNSLCAKGDKISGFVVEKITPNSVVLGQGSFRFELRIQK
ncbi:MAG TPA: hypothetical protein VG722_05320 [Tepidisphaeraceae bacterium]|nr:hypothetical protein [Tepidisphaeraceae bacterium]